MYTHIHIYIYIYIYILHIGRSSSPYDLSRTCGDY